MNRIILSVLVGTAVLSLTPVESYAQSRTAASSKSPGYVVDRNGNTVKTRTGNCVRARSWSQAMETPECRDASMKVQSSGKR
jgi:hypothetical protein